LEQQLLLLQEQQDCLGCLVLSVLPSMNSSSSCMVHQQVEGGSLLQAMQQVTVASSVP
jgi:hypothetical protein